MNYYEELGLSPWATEDEIRQAYRRLVKLLHPDQQTDATMKALAEVQLRRLNTVIDVLSHPEKRRYYNEQVLGLKPGETGYIKPKRRWLYPAERLTVIVCSTVIFVSVAIIVMRMKIAHDSVETRAQIVTRYLPPVTLPSTGTPPRHVEGDSSKTQPAASNGGVPSRSGKIEKNPNPQWSASTVAVPHTSQRGPAAIPPSAGQRAPEPKTLREKDLVAPRMPAPKPQTVVIAPAPDLNVNPANMPVTQNPLPAAVPYDPPPPPPKREQNAGSGGEGEPKLEQKPDRAPPPGTAPKPNAEHESSGSDTSPVPVPFSQLRVVRKVAPVYPALAKSNHVEGTVEFVATIDPHGMVKDLRLLRGDRVLAEAARAAVLQWSFQPTMLHGTPVSATTKISVAFQLPGRK
ncbi:MAG: TonB family protein [Acidobacteriaceae bacterium]|nr:TonB family protein [Acidobacteriaceae bacterium]